MRINLNRVAHPFPRFLHASLQLEALRDCTSVHDIKATLEEFPTRIEDVYTQTWRRIQDQPRRKAQLVQNFLLWVLTANRSMTIKELQYAIATSPDTHRFDTDRIAEESTLIALCRGLVTVEEKPKGPKGGLVRLVRKFCIILHKDGI